MSTSVAKEVDFDHLEWISISVVGLVATVIIIYMSQNEINKRKSGAASFTTKWLQLWSFLVLLSGLLHTTGVFLQYFNGFCYFTGMIRKCSSLIQPFFMGCYQLSNMYYSFKTKGKSHSNRGYPKWVFIIMFSIAALCATNTLLLGFLMSIPEHCSIASDFSYHGSFIFVAPIDAVTLNISIGFVVYMSWDLTILILYASKIRSLNRFKTDSEEAKNINKLILYMLHRILIITLFYQILFTLFLSIFVGVMQNMSDWFWLTFITETCSAIVSILYCYSIRIMMEHNTIEYINLLKCLSYFKLNYICCCYRNIVTEQLRELLLTQKQVQTKHQNQSANKEHRNKNDNYAENDESTNAVTNTDATSTKTTSSELEMYRLQNKIFFQNANINDNKNDKTLSTIRESMDSTVTDGVVDIDVTRTIDINNEET